MAFTFCVVLKSQRQWPCSTPGAASPGATAGLNAARPEVPALTRVAPARLRPTSRRSHRSRNRVSDLNQLCSWCSAPQRTVGHLGGQEGCAFEDEPPFPISIKARLIIQTRSKQRNELQSLVRLVGRSDDTSPLRLRTRGAAPRFCCETAVALPASGRRKCSGRCPVSRRL